jgi:hypothetical protein
MKFLKFSMRILCLGYNCNGTNVPFGVQLLLLLVIWVLQRDGKLGAWARLGWLLEARDNGVFNKACITPGYFLKPAFLSGTVPCNSTYYLPTVRICKRIPHQCRFVGDPAGSPRQRSHCRLHPDTGGSEYTQVRPQQVWKTVENPRALEDESETLRVG